MKNKISSLSKSEDFKTLLKGKKISNRYLTIFFKNISSKSDKFLNVSFVAKKKIGNAVKRNKIKRRLRSMMQDALKNLNLNLNYSYLLIARKSVFEDKYREIKECLFKDLIKIK